MSPLDFPHPTLLRAAKPPSSANLARSGVNHMCRTLTAADNQDLLQMGGQQ